MSSALSEGPGRPGPGAVAGTVFRSELNPVDFLYRAAYLYPEKVAVAAGKRRYSYQELAERSWRLANALRSAGLAKGDRVAALLFNSPAMLEAHFGVPAAGGILVAVNNRLSRRRDRLHPAAQRREVPAAGHGTRGGRRGVRPGRGDRDPL